MTFVAFHLSSLARWLHVRSEKHASARKLLVWWAAAMLASSPLPARSAEANTFTLFLAGDTIIMRPISDNEEPSFLQLVDEMRSADAAIVNLETLLHNFNGFPQAEAGGTYMASSPSLAKDLAWAGVDMVSTANNHTFDYGAIGVLENLDHLSRSQIIAAGSGKDLQEARAQKQFRRPEATVALVSAAATFIPYGIASRSRSDQRGRPGLNPLRTVSNTEIVMPAGVADFLASVENLFGYSDSRYSRKRFKLFGYDVVRGNSFAIHTGDRPMPKDLDAILQEIRTASKSADITIFSLHDHRQADWLQGFAHQVLDAGADVFFAHGPHEIRGIEIHKGRPIFYSLGDFFYEPHHIARLPSENYDEYNLGDDASVADAMKARFAKYGEIKQRKPWEGLAAVVTFRDRVMQNVRLIPLDLGIGQPIKQRGRPQRANPSLGQSIIDVAKSQSKKFGTEITYNADRNSGLIVNDRAMNRSRERD